MKNSLTLLSLANKFFNSFREENDERIYTYNDDCMRWFVRQSIKGGICSVLNQYYKYIVSDEVFSISKEFIINGILGEFLDKHFEVINKQWKKIGTGYDSQFEDHRDTIENE